MDGWIYMYIYDDVAITLKKKKKKMNLGRKSTFCVTDVTKHVYSLNPLHIFSRHVKNLRFKNSLQNPCAPLRNNTSQWDVKSRDQRHIQNLNLGFLRQGVRFIKWKVAFEFSFFSSFFFPFFFFFKTSETYEICDHSPLERAKRAKSVNVVTNMLAVQTVCRRTELKLHAGYYFIYPDTLLQKYKLNRFSLSLFLSLSRD